MTRHDLRELAALTALGLVLGVAHLALRPGLPLLAAPAAQCSADEAGPPVLMESEPLASEPPASMIDGGAP